MKKIDIAILGSCVSRDNFNSLFNKEWRKSFNVVAHQHQTSIVSLMNKKVEIPKSLLEELLRDFDKNCLVSDFKKDFLNNVVKLQPEYLIIDFFADAYYGVLQLAESKYITNNVGKLGNTTFYKELVNKKPINFIDANEEFFKLWIDSVEKLFEWLNENLPNTAILVSKFYFSDQYKCSMTNEIKHIRESGKHFVKSKEIYNRILKAIYNYIDKYENIRYIDLTKKDYLLNDNHSWGLYYVHYEESYYHNYINQLEKIVAEDNYQKSKEININVKNIYFDHENGDFNLELEFFEFSNVKINKICFIERKNGLGNTLFNPIKIFFDAEKNDKGLNVNINFIDYFSILAQCEVWDVYVYDEINSLFYRCNMEQISEFKVQYLIKGYQGIKPYKNGLNKLSIYSRLLIDRVNAFDCSTNEEIRISFDKFLIESINNQAVVRLKRRIHRFMDSFDHTIDFNIEKNEVIINLDRFLGNELIQGDVYESFLVFNPNDGEEYEIPIHIEKIESQSIVSNEVFKVKKFISGNEIFSLFFTYQNNLKIKFLELDDNGYMKLNFNRVGNFIIKSLRLIPFNNINYLRQGYLISDEAIKYSSDSIIIDLNRVYSLFKMESRFILVAQVEITQTNKSKVVESIYFTKGESFSNGQYRNNLFTIDINEGKSKECVFNIYRRHNIAVLGSCYSRAAFNSSNYYNPGYKDRYSIVLTQFHSSLISIMGEKKKIFEEHYFNKLKEANKKFIKNDFEKEFFNLLKDSQSNYLIIDLYADAQRGVIIFPDESIITGSLDVEGSQLIFNLPNGTKVISSSDTSTYLPMWIEAAKKFAEKIVKYIPEEKIIINYINATDRYLDKDGKRVIYEKNIDFIKKSNLLLDWMNNYLKSLLPKAKVIDTRKLNYIGYEKHPLGNTPNHYESGYYKDFMRLVDEIILNDI